MFTQISLLGKTIPTYSLAAAVGIIAAVFYTKKRVRNEYYIDLDRHLELELVCALAGTAAGAKILYLLIECRHVIADIGEYGLAKARYSYLAGGFVFYGGLLGCMMAIYFYCRSADVSFSHSLQLVLPAFPLAHAFGRIGCYVTGCCFGKETHGLLHVIYSNSAFAPNSVPLVPVQLIESIYEFALFFVLYADSKHKVPGYVMLSKYAVLYGTGRFVLEFFRGDGYRGYIGLLSVSQVISLACVAAGTVYITYYSKQSVQRNRNA